MSEYTKDEIMAMQEDALRRVREMQRRANLNEQNNTNRQQNRQQNRRPTTSQSQSPRREGPAAPVNAQTQQPLPAEKPPKRDGSLQAAMQRMDIDNDRWMLILLLFTLIREGADQNLLLALCYLIL